MILRDSERPPRHDPLAHSPAQGTDSPLRQGAGRAAPAERGACQDHGKAGCEALFVGTGGVVGAYTGLADVGTATMSECVTIAGWIADSVSIPGDDRRRYRARRDHGGAAPDPRSIRAGLAGIRIDDQPIEGKRKTQNAGIDVVPLDQAIARYRAAVDMKNELDPNFVVMAQCYARDAPAARSTIRSRA